MIKPKVFVSGKRPSLSKSPNIFINSGAYVDGSNMSYDLQNDSSNA